MDLFYKLLTSLLSPVIFLWLLIRCVKGKEDKARLPERFGFASIKRPPGRLIWFHAASVGEANSVLLMIEHIRRLVPQSPVLMTTGTVTSAQLMKKRLPPGAIHQYVPVDTPAATMRFIRHWRPDIAFWVESEFWPNLIGAAVRYSVYMGVLNGRMSQKSFGFWQRNPSLGLRMIKSFHSIFAQSDDDAGRFKALGAKNVMSIGNLKYDASMLPCDEAELLRLKLSIGERPVWLAASTHPGEEQMAASVHSTLRVTHPSLLTIIVPRHPARGPDIAATLKNFKVALRSKNDVIAADTAFYIADTLGELGLFYRLGEIAFMGGSLIQHGGQNPLEPARLSCAILSGPYVYNFADIYEEMRRAGGCIGVRTPEELAGQIKLLFENPSTTQALQDRARTWVESKEGATAKLLSLIQPVLTDMNA